MRFSKELLYHFSCESCHNWWSFPSTAEIRFRHKSWYCPHCQYEHKPPHHNELEDKIAEAIENLKV